MSNDSIPRISSCSLCPSLNAIRIRYYDARRKIPAVTYAERRRKPLAAMTVFISLAVACLLASSVHLLNPHIVNGLVSPVLLACSIVFFVLGLGCIPKLNDLSIELRTPDQQKILDDPVYILTAKTLDAADGVDSLIHVWNAGVNKQEAWIAFMDGDRVLEVLTYITKEIERSALFCEAAIDQTPGNVPKFEAGAHVPLDKVNALAKCLGRVTGFLEEALRDKRDAEIAFEPKIGSL